jgi:hypothetical protein
LVHTPPPQPYGGPDWRLADAALQRTVKDKYAEDPVRVKDILHHLHIQDQLLTMENKGLESALRQQKKGNTKSRALPFVQRQNWDGETQWWSPSRVNKAQQVLDEQMRQRRQMRSEKLTQLSSVRPVESLSRSLTPGRQKSERERERGRRE